MSESVTLDTFLERGAPSDADEVLFATHVLQSGLQDLLTLMIGVYAGSTVHHKRVPPGFVGKFGQALSKPVLGGLLDFLHWISSEEEDSSLSPLSEYLQSYERRDTGWLNRLIQLRNRWAHPRDGDPEQVLATVVAHLSDIPDFASLGKLEISDSDTVFWSGGGDKHLLQPFVFSRLGEMVVFTEYRPPNRLVFPQPDPVNQKRFEEIWREVRVLDSALEDPTPEDIAGKIMNLSLGCSYNGEKLWWFEDLFRPGPVGALVAPDVLDGLLANCTHIWPGMAAIDLVPSQGETPMDALAALLGLARAPTFEELVSFASGKKPYLIVVRAYTIASQDLLKLLHWLADLSASGALAYLRILIGREAEQLARDQEKLWDRLPDRIDQILRKPPRSSEMELSEYQWTSRQRKRLFGIF